MLLIPSSSFVFDWSDRANAACALQTHSPRRARSGGTVRPGESGAPRHCSWVFAPLEGAHAFEELNINPRSIFRQNAAIDKRGGLLSSWKAEEMLVPEPSLLLGKVKLFQASYVSAQGVQAHQSQKLGWPQHPAHSYLSLSPQLPWSKHCWKKVCSMR